MTAKGLMKHPEHIDYRRACDTDAGEIAGLRNSAADALAARHGPGHWSGQVTERGVLFQMRLGTVLIARASRGIIGTLTLQTRKPWAIDVAYFTPVPRALYLTSMAILPSHQGQGIGRGLLEAAERCAREWPAQSIRLDAYQGPAGAGRFYTRCGYQETGRVIYKTVPLIYFERLLESQANR